MFPILVFIRTIAKMIPTPFDNVEGYAVILDEPSGAVWPRLDIRLTEVSAFSLIFVIDRANRKVSHMYPTK